MSSIRRIPAPPGFHADLVIPPRIGPAADAAPPVLAKRAGQVESIRSLPGWPPLHDTRARRLDAWTAQAKPDADRVNWYFVAAAVFAVGAFVLMIVGAMAGLAALWLVLA